MLRRHFGLSFAWVGLAAAFAAGSLTLAEEIPFRVDELSTRLGVGYAVRLLDMNGDAKLDIAIVDQRRIIWLENPTWKEHTLIDGQTKPDNVCFAPADIDGDGQIDFAVGADWKPFNTKSGGSIDWISRGQAGAKWDLHFIAEEPTVHRMQFADLDGNGRPELLVVPLMGPGTTAPHWAEAGVRVLAFTIPADPRKDRWPVEVLNNDLHVCHNFQPVDLDGDGKLEILLVGFEGVHLLRRAANGKWQRTHLGEGDQKSSPNKGASEIKLGRLADKTPYIATIEPWHGNKVVVYTPPPATARPQDAAAAPLWTRHVLDDALQWGHAVWCANLDADADEELIIGVRDNKSADHPCGVRIYDPLDAAAGKWAVQRLDPGGVAIEDLAAGDLNGDGKIDLVAVGRATKNVRIYWHE